MELFFRSRPKAEQINISLYLIKLRITNIKVITEKLQHKKKMLNVLKEEEREIKEQNGKADGEDDRHEKLIKK